MNQPRRGFSEFVAVADFRTDCTGYCSSRIGSESCGQPLEVSVSDNADAVKQTQQVINKSVEFEDLPGGSYAVQIAAAKIAIDQFRAELRLDEPS